MLYVKTIVDTQWHQDDRGHFVIPAGTECTTLDNPTQKEERLVRSAADKGKRLALVQLDGRRRLISKEKLRRVR